MRTVNFSNSEEFIKHVNMLRKQHKTEWIFLEGCIGTEPYYYKAYGTWIQRFLFKGIRYGNCGDQSVSQFLNYLNNIKY